MENEPKPVVTGYPAAAQPPYGAHAQGTGYPYTAPPPPYYAAPPPPPGPYYVPAAAAYGSGSSSSTTFFRRMIVLFIAVFLVVGFATFVVWLVIRPHLPAFAVSSASVSSFNVSGVSQLISADFNLSLSVRNPNKKMGISYNRVEAAVLYRSEMISETELPPFYQGKENSTVVPANLAAVSRYVVADVADGITKDRSSNGGAVVFQVRVIAWVTFRSGGWRTRRHFMRVYCDNVKIGFSNATASVGSLAGPPQSCAVRI